VIEQPRVTVRERDLSVWLRHQAAGIGVKHLIFAVQPGAIHHRLQPHFRRLLLQPGLDRGDVLDGQTYG